MRTHLAISSGAAKSLREHIAWAHPWEAVGFLGGAEVATRVFAARSSSSAGRTFQLYRSDIERFAAKARESGEALLAIYHSHPSGVLRLSAEDERAIAHSPWPWVVLTLDQGTLRAQGYRAGDATPFPVALPSLGEPAQHVLERLP
ncbi:MAG: Mov34/MPN/PAD-1 family protein [Myxococcota bacterium]